MKSYQYQAFLLATIVALSACKPSGPSPEYQAVCEGAPLRTIERRQQAMQDGYEIDTGHDCITKRSAKVIAEQKSQWEAANSPEGKAARQAESERQSAAATARREMEAKTEAEARAARERQQWAAAEQAPVHSVDINTATEEELASVQGLDSEVARQIVAERSKGRFQSWDDVVRRVGGLAAAETAVRASAFGLMVNGRSLEGAEPESQMARFAREKWRRRGTQER